LSSTPNEFEGSCKEKKKCRGASLRGQGSPGFILPASAVSEQENCGGDAKPPNFVLFRFASNKTLKPFFAGFASTSPETR
jgi:hypothetical protein